MTELDHLVTNGIGGAAAVDDCDAGR